MRKKSGSLFLKLVLFATIFCGLRLGYHYYTMEIQKLPVIPDGVFIIVSFLAIVSASFFLKIWRYILRPALTFLIIVPFITKGIYWGLDLLEIEVQPFMKMNIYYASYSLAGYLSTLGFFLIKNAFWGLINLVIIKPIKMFYGGLDDFFRYVESWFFKSPDSIKNFMREIDNIQGNSDYERGTIFEKIVSDAYNRLGYYSQTTGEMRKKGLLPEGIQRRGGSGEQGVDVFVEIPPEYTENGSGAIMAVQCKLYKNKVDNKAVQEIVAALPLYGADFGVVVTNNYFTAPARELARANGIELVNRDKLQELLENSYKKAS